MRLLLATTNLGKLGEIRELLAGLPVDVRALADYPPIDPPDETGHTFVENARQKALFYAPRTGILTVAEDSGLEIEPLGGAPGVHSARFGGADSSYPEKFALIYEKLRLVPDAERTARFVCALAVADAGRIVFEARGTVEGRIAPEPRGAGGFGYDPIFVPVGWDITMAELTDEQKDRISHRGRAFRALLEILQGAPDLGEPGGLPNSR